MSGWLNIPVYGVLLGLLYQQALVYLFGLWRREDFNYGYVILPIALSPLGETGRDEAAPDRSVLAGADPGRGGDRSLRAGGAGRGIYDPFPVPLVDRLRPVLAASGVGETDGRRVPRHVPSGDVPPAEPHLRQPLPPVAVDLLAGRRGHDPVIRDDRVP